MRSLAEKSAEAASSTTQLIENSLKAVEHGTLVADDTAAALSAIVGTISEVNLLMAKIAESSGSQAASLEEIASEISDISGVTQRATSAAEESRSVAQEFQSNAQNLDVIISSFKL